MTQLNETVDFLNSISDGFRPEIGIVLGSGLGEFTKNLKGISVQYSKIPHFGFSSVQGHKGELLFSKIHDKNCAIMQGRFHFYEGNSLALCTYPIKVLKKLGVKTLFITNAAGAINQSFNVGDIMMFEDHINFLGTNPLIGKNDDSLGPRFPDMSEVYSLKLQKLALKTAKTQNLDLKKGVYIATTGPSYETKAEIRAFRTLGADVVGMSSVPEAIVASYLKMEVIAFSLVTNFASGVSNQVLSHKEVLETGKTSGLKLCNLIKEMIKTL